MEGSIFTTDDFLNTSNSSTPFPNTSIASTATESPPTSNLWMYLIYIFTPPIVILGLFGNILTIIIILSSSFATLNIGVYLTALALSDIVCLFVFTLTRTFLDVTFDIYIDVVSVFGCKAITYIHYTFSYISSWIIVAMTIERLYITLHPFKARTACTRKLAVIIVISICIASCSVNITYLFFFNVFDDVDGYKYCRQINEKVQVLTTIVDFVLYSLLPSIVLVLSNTVMMCALNKRQALRRSISAIGSNDEAKKTNAIFMLLTVSTTFVLLTSPVSLYYICLALFKFTETSVVLFIRTILQVLTSANHAVNFFLYCLSGPAFRSEIKRLWEKCWAKCCCTCCYGNGLNKRKRLISTTSAKDGHFKEDQMEDSNTGCVSSTDTIVWVTKL